MDARDDRGNEFKLPAPGFFRARFRRNKTEASTQRSCEAPKLDTVFCLGLGSLFIRIYATRDPVLALPQEPAQRASFSVHLKVVSTTGNVWDPALSDFCDHIDRSGLKGLATHIEWVKNLYNWTTHPCKTTSNIVKHLWIIFIYIWKIFTLN